MKKLTETKIAKQLGVSRPTLYKMRKRGEKISTPELDIDTQRICIKLSALHKNTSPNEIESILEFLGDYRYLSNEGIGFASNYWKLFIKE